MSQPEYGSSENARSGASPGQVFGDYVFLEQLSDSRTGSVWKAQHRTTGAIVALKMLSQAAMTSATMIERFHRQVQILAELRHPNLIVAYEGGRLEGVPYLVMEYIEGQDLRSLVKQRGPFPVQEAVEHIIQAAAGLASAHARGIWHRNVKPANLMVDRSGLIRVTGFGLAHVESSENAGNVALTMQGQAMGTGDYMAPEQTVDASSVNARADIYSLGCALCMLLTGRPPYRAKSWVQMVGAHLTAPIPSLAASRSDVPQALDAVFQKMLAKQPGDRYGSMEEVIAALRGSLVTVEPARPDLQGPVLPMVAWPEPLGPATAPVPSPALQGPVMPTVAWPEPQGPAMPAVAWPEPQGPVMPAVAWPEPQGPAMAAVPSPGLQAPAMPAVAWPEPQGAFMPLVPPPAEPAAPLDVGYFEMARSERKIPRWVFGLVGYVVSALMGLVLAYFLIKWIFPGRHLPSLW